MIPDEYIDFNRRMRWEFVWNEDGALRPEITALGFNPGIPSDEDPTANIADLWRLLDKLFPYQITPASLSMEDFSEGGAKFEETHKWLRENVRGCWQLWFPHGKSMSEQHLLMFQNEADAVLFKLRWC